MARPTQVNTDIIPMARGTASPGTSRSAGNIMPGPSAISGASKGGIRGAGAGLAGIPARGGAPHSAAGSYMNTPGAPAQTNATPGPGTVPKSALGGASHQALTHGRTLGAIKHLKSLGFSHPDLDVHHGNATKALTGMGKSKAKNTVMSGGFGSIGGNTGQTPGMPSPAGTMPPTFDADDGI